LAAQKENQITKKANNDINKLKAEAEATKKKIMQAELELECFKKTQVV
jgi:archaellum component FlaC